MAKLFVLILAFSICYVAPPVHAVDNDQLVQVRQLTQSLIDLINEISHAQPSEASTLSRQAVDLAKRRRELLLQLAAASPKDALQLTLPADLAAKLPSVAQAFAERDAE